MKNKILFLFLFTCIAVSICNTSNAQFWKKKSERKHHRHKEAQDSTAPGNSNREAEREKRKESRKMEREERKKEKEERKKEHKRERHHKGKHEKVKKKVIKKAPLPEVKAIEQPAWPPTTVKSRYRVEVLTPLYLDELLKARAANKEKIKEKAYPGIAFYEGVQIAADSLKNAGFNIDIYIHDAASEDSAGALVKNGKLDSADLVIGAVQSHDVPVLAAFAQKKQINFISTLSASDGGVTDNPYFTMLEPSLKSHCEWIANDIIKKFPGQKITILHRNITLADENAYKYLTSNDSIHLNYAQLLCNTLPPKDSLAEFFDTVNPNIVIISTLDRAFADSLMNRISDYFPTARFQVYGMPSWYGAKFTIWNDFPNIDINVTYPYHFDPSSGIARYIEHKCKDQFGHKASELVFRGYETMYWYANLLRQYGTIFNDDYSDINAAPFTKFNVKMLRDNEGKILYNENENISIATYQTGNNKVE